MLISVMPEEIFSFLKLAFHDNRWLWFHCLAGGLLSRFIRLQYIFFLAIAWEIFEFYVTEFGKLPKFWADAFGDVTGAMLGALVVTMKLPFSRETER